MKVIPFTDSEVSEDLIELDIQYFPFPWSYESWKGFDPQINKLFKIVDQENLVGFALFQSVPGDDCAHLHKILILPRERGRGLAKESLKVMMKELAEMGWCKVYLEVESSNQPAVRLYQALGFQVLREIKNFYGSGRHALAMSTGIA